MQCEMTWQELFEARTAFRNRMQAPSNAKINLHAVTDFVDFVPDAPKFESRTRDNSRRSAMDDTSLQRRTALRTYLDALNDKTREHYDADVLQEIYFERSLTIVTFE